MRSIPQIAVDFVAEHEGFRGVAYLDSVNVPTIGYGHIEGVKLGQRTTRAKALEWLTDDMGIAQSRLYTVLKTDVIDMLTEHQWSALLSFVFNLGADPKWTIWKRLNAKQFDQVPLEMMKFVNAAGQKIQGLVNRRADEIKLWSTDEPGSVVEPVSSAVTRSVETTPTPGSPISPGKSATVLTTAVTAVGTTSVAGKAVYDAVNPFAKDSPVIQNMIATIAIALAVLAGIAALLVFIQKRKQRS